MKKNIKIPFSISGISKTSDELCEDVKNMLETEKEQRNGRKRANNDKNVTNTAKKVKLSMTYYLNSPEELADQDIIHRIKKNYGQDE